MYQKSKINFTYANNSTLRKAKGPTDAEPNVQNITYTVIISLEAVADACRENYGTAVVFGGLPHPLYLARQ